MVEDQHKRKVFILDNDVTGVRYNTQWSDFVPDEVTSWGYNCEVIKGLQNPQFGKGLINNFRSEANLANNFSFLLQNGHIPNDAIFIFPNARNPLILLINELKFLNKTDYKFIGFWDEGMYYTYLNWKSNFYYGKYKGDYNWSLKYEKFLSSCYDYNLINNEHQLEHFNRHLAGNKSKNVRLCPNPFSSIYNYSAQKEFIKENLIISIARNGSEHDKFLFYNMRKIFPEYEFVLAYEKKHNIIEHYRLLSKAKVIISHSARESNPFPIWEAMCFGCIPLIPNTKINRMMFNMDEFTFPRKILIPPFLNYIKNRHLIFDKIKGYINLYDDYLEQVNLIKESAYLKYFNSDGLKQILKEISNE